MKPSISEPSPRARQERRAPAISATVADARDLATYMWSVGHGLSTMIIDEALKKFYEDDTDEIIDLSAPGVGLEPTTNGLTVRFGAIT